MMMLRKELYHHSLPASGLLSHLSHYVYVLNPLVTYSKRVPKILSFTYFLYVVAPHNGIVSWYSDKHVRFQIEREQNIGLYPAGQVPGP